MAHELHYAVGRNEVATVAMLLASGADVNATDEDGGTPLHVAAAMNNVGLAKFLLDHGARVDTFDRAGHSPVQVAQQRGNKAVLEVLRQAPGYSPLGRAAE